MTNFKKHGMLKSSNGGDPAQLRREDEMHEKNPARISRLPKRKEAEDETLGLRTMVFETRRSLRRWRLVTIMGWWWRTVPPTIKLYKQYRVL